MCEQLVFSPLEGVLAGNLDTDRQLLEASKSGDLETVKVNRVIIYSTEHTLRDQRPSLNRQSYQHLSDINNIIVIQRSNSRPDGRRVSIRENAFLVFRLE